MEYGIPLQFAMLAKVENSQQKAKSIKLFIRIFVDLQ